MSNVSAIPQAHAPSGPSLDAGAYRGSIKNYIPTRVTSRPQRAFERNLASARVEDIYLNDGVAKSGVNSISTNVIGTGLKPQSCIAYKMLGLQREDVAALQDQMEWLWEEWCSQAHYREQMCFEDMQMLGLRSLIRAGEMLHLPVMDERPGSRFALRLQDVLPQRLRTPWNKQYDPLIHDGVEVTPSGVPVAYWIASPPPSSFLVDDMASSSDVFRRIPARIGHRRGIFHVFRTESEESFRGVSCLAPALKFFRHLNDAIDYELMAQVIAAAFPVFIGREETNQLLPPGVQEEEGEDGEKVYYQEIHEGQVLYGNKGEKPEVLESKRPSQNFISFCDLILRITASSLEVPYEVLTKDFSKTTYSSARAALLEAWRVYGVYRSFFTRHYCQPVYQMVMEEAWLRGYFTLPAGAPDFYDGLRFWCNARWIGPARGYIDPEKEIKASIAAIGAGLMSRQQHIAENGGDFDEVTEQRAYERDQYEELGLTASAKEPSGVAPEDGEDDGKSKEESPRA
jgi:lambda family phage portal protein